MIHSANTLLIIVLLSLVIPNSILGSEVNCSDKHSGHFVFTIDREKYMVKLKNVGSDSLYLSASYLCWSKSSYLKRKCMWNGCGILKEVNPPISGWLLPDSCISLEILEPGVFDDTTSLYHIKFQEDLICNDLWENVILNINGNPIIDINGNPILKLPCVPDTMPRLIVTTKNTNSKSRKAQRNIWLDLNKQGNIEIIYNNGKFGLDGKVKTYQK